MEVGEDGGFDGDEFGKDVDVVEFQDLKVWADPREGKLFVVETVTIYEIRRGGEVDVREREEPSRRERERLPRRQVGRSGGL